MRKSIAVVAAISAMVWMSGCGDRDPVSSQNEGMDSAAGKLTVSTTKARGKCELPPCKGSAYWGDGTGAPPPKPGSGGSAKIRLEYLSGNGQTYAGGMPFPMVFKIKNTLTNEYVTSLSALNLSMIASASQGRQDFPFNNENNYDSQGSEAFGGWYYVEPNGGAYTLRITVSLYQNGVLIDSYLIGQNILYNYL